MGKGTPSNPLAEVINSVFWLTREGANNIFRGVANPDKDNDATPKGYVDAAIAAAIASNTIIKAQVELAAIGNVNIASAPATFDGTAPATSGVSRILLPDQTTQADRGIYIWNGAGSAMTRATDFDASSEVKAGMLVIVTNGVDNEDTAYELITNNPITIGVTSLAFARTSLLPVIAKTAAQMNTLSLAGTLRPYQLYNVTNAAFQGSTVSYFVRSTGDGTTIESNGYIVRSGVAYPLSWDLTTNQVLSFIDPVYNNRISRSVGSAATCIDNFPLGNPLYQDVFGHDFFLTDDHNAGNIFMNVTIEPQSQIFISGGSQLVLSFIGTQVVVTLANASALNGGTLEANCQIDIGATAQSFSYGSTFLRGGSATIDNASQLNGCEISMDISLDNSTVLSGCFLKMTGLSPILINDGVARTNQRFEPGFSNMTATLVITGLTDANLGPIFWAGVVTLSSTNPTETLDTITNMNGNHDVTFEPESGLVVTFDDQSVAAGNIYLPITIATTAINGTNLDFMQIRKRVVAGSPKHLQVNSQQY